MCKRLRLGRFEFYLEPRDIWVGAFVGEFAVYVCPLPCVVIRWDRTKRDPRPADPPVSLTHRTTCLDLHRHVPAVGFDKSTPEWGGIEHGESMLDAAQRDQCMCGHPEYYMCPDWLIAVEPSHRCRDSEHGDQCGREGWNDDLHQWQPDMCPCNCHDLPLSEAIKEAARAS